MLPQSYAKTSFKGSSLGQRGAFWEVILATTPRFPAIWTGFSGSSRPTELSGGSFPLTSEQDGNLAARSFLFLPFSWLLLSFLSPSLNAYQRTWAGYCSHNGITSHYSLHSSNFLLTCRGFPRLFWSCSPLTALQTTYRPRECEIVGTLVMPPFVWHHSCQSGSVPLTPTYLVRLQ